MKNDIIGSQSIAPPLALEVAIYHYGSLTYFWRTRKCDEDHNKTAAG